jgi:hypothetical protein
MYGQYRNSGIGSLSTYEEAKRRHDSVEPISGNGRNSGIRPLGRRNKPHFEIVMRDQDVACVCYNTDVVTFHPDNTITIRDGGYTTQTTANFIKDVLRIGAGIKDHDIILFGGSNPTRLMSKVRLQAEGNARYTIIESGKHYTHKLNRKRMNELRKSVAPFMQYARGAVKLRDGVFEANEVRAGMEELGIDVLSFAQVNLGTNIWNMNASERRSRMQKFYKMVTEGGVENWYSPFLWLTRSATTTSFSTIRVTTQGITQAVDDLLIALHPDVLEATETPRGTIKVDRYARFVPFIELTKKEET